MSSISDSETTGADDTTWHPDGDRPALVGPSHARRSASSLTALVRSSLPTQRAAWSLVWLGVLTGGVSLWGTWWASPFIGALAPALVLAGVLGILASWSLDAVGSRWFQRTGLGAVLVAVAAPQAVSIHGSRYYSTDEGALTHVAAQVLLRGANPYSVSLASAGRLLMTPARFWTYTASGGHVTHFSYPAGGFLIDVPAFALGFHHQVVNWMDLGCWVLSGIILFVLLPVELRWMAGLVALSPVFVSDFVTGGTAVTFYPFILIAVWRWDRFGTGQGSRAARWAGPLALGLGCAIKQTPWFIVPFLLLGVGIEARRRGRAGTTVSLEYLALVLVAFGAVNLPFVLWHPADWWRGTFLPLGASLVADGQGLVSLATHGLTGGVNLSLFTLAGALAYVTIVAAFALYYERLKIVWPLLVPIGFFFAPRSFTSYLVALFPVALVAATTVTPPDRRRRDRTHERRVHRLVGPGLLIALSLGTAVTAGVALGATSPLSITSPTLSASRATGTVRSVTISVRNRTARPLTPHFMVDVGGAHPAGFWYPRGHRTVDIGPDQRVVLTLYPPEPTTLPVQRSNWVVDAYTLDPEWLSTSSLAFWPGQIVSSSTGT